MWAKKGLLASLVIPGGGIKENNAYGFAILFLF
jgi:hypothetical protein